MFGGSLGFGFVDASGPSCRGFFGIMGTRLSTLISVNGSGLRIGALYHVCGHLRGAQGQDEAE